RCALDPRLNVFRWGDPTHLYSDFEGETHVGNAGFQYSVIVSGVQRLEVAHALDTRRKERRIAERFEHRFARCIYRNFSDNIQDKISLAPGINRLDYVNAANESSSKSNPSLPLPLKNPQGFMGFL